jgi:hypothetical protein
VPHDLFAEAVRVAAARLDAEPSRNFLELRLESALDAALRDLVEDGVKVAARRQFHLPGWDPQPGGIDLFLLNQERALSHVAELKIDNIDEALWDLFKMVAATELSSVQAAYLVVAARAQRWRNPRVDCAVLFPEAPTPPRVWPSRQLFADFDTAWRALLKGGRARPTDVPAEVRIEFVANEPVCAYPDYELRAIAVRGVPGAERLRFDGGWPRPSLLA